MVRQLTLLTWCVVVTLLGLPQVAFAQAEATQTVKYWAVICGVADYENISDLDYTDDDANDLADALKQYAEWQYAEWGDPDQIKIKILIDSDASKEGIRQAIIDMGVKANAGDVCLFFFSGHGTQVKEVKGASRDERDRKDEAICAWDTYFSKNNVYNVITDDELASWLEDYLPENADIVAVFDTCFAGGMAKGAQGAKGLSVKSVRNPNLAPGAKVRRHFGRGLAQRLAARGAKGRVTGSEDIRGANAVVLMACEEGRYSYETGDLGNGVFSHYVVEGLRDPSIDGLENGKADGFISAEEDFAYAAPKTTDFESRQVPRLYDGDTNVEALLVYVGELPDPPVAAFTADPTSGPAPLTVTFADQSTGDIDTWSWEFGDGGTSSDQNPTHEYTSSGTYTVTLEVTGPDGTDTETKTDYITVSEELADVVTITKAEYNSRKGELKVEATSTLPGDTTYFLTVEGYGPMDYDRRKNIYKFRDKGVADPGGTVTVTSSSGGSATESVTSRGRGSTANRKPGR